MDPGAGDRIRGVGGRNGDRGLLHPSQIPVDCADVPYATRWIYARIAHLPAAATTRDGKLIGTGPRIGASFRHTPYGIRIAVSELLSSTCSLKRPLEHFPRTRYPIRIDSHSRYARDRLLHH